MNCKKETNAKKCSCTYEPCSRKGSCCDCVVYHRESGYDRSIANFIRTTKKI